MSFHGVSFQTGSKINTSQMPIDSCHNFTRRVSSRPSPGVLPASHFSCFSPNLLWRHQTYSEHCNSTACMSPLFFNFHCFRLHNYTDAPGMARNPKRAPLTFSLLDENFIEEEKSSGLFFTLEGEICHADSPVKHGSRSKCESLSGDRRTEESNDCAPALMSVGCTNSEGTGTKWVYIVWIFVYPRDASKFIPQRWIKGSLWYY